jgi:DNA invertase Pin-like site-specific DNA recombinase
MAAAPSKVVHCAIYTRVSTDAGLDQEFNSLDAQFDAAQAYIRSQIHAGWTMVRSRYDDGGFSGGSTDRPALQQLLADIKDGTRLLPGRDSCVTTKAAFSRLTDSSSERSP